MAERKVKKKKKGDQDQTTLTKDDQVVAKYLRFNLTTKKSMMFGDETEYFFGSKAVDCLLDSKWAKGTAKSSVEFTDRQSVADFMSKLLENGLFSHVHLIKKEKKLKDKKGDDKKKKTTDSKSTPDKKSADGGSAPGTPRSKKDGKEPRKVKKKVKITLEMHEHQIFCDDDEEAYAWIFDPISPKTFILGVLLVLGVVAICLFPLWPENIREYSWYLSVGGAIFVGGILVLAVLRYIVYGVVWVCTFGKLDFWMLPNLTAECGFFESFVPGYEFAWKEEKTEDSTTDDKTDGNEEEKSTEDSKNLDGELEERPPAPVDDNEISGDLDEDTAELGDEKLESEGSSNGSLKDSEDWVKVKKDEVEEELMETGEAC